MAELAPWGSRFFLRRLGLISVRDGVQKFFGKKDEKTPIIGSGKKSDWMPIIDITQCIKLYFIIVLYIFNFTYAIHLTHIPQEDRSKCHHFFCHRFEILKSNVLIISEIFIKDILHFHDLAGYMLAHCTWHEHE